MPTANAPQLTTRIVASFVERNSIPTDDLPNLIASVHRAIATVGDDEAPADDQRKATTAQVRKSITPEALISFEDGKPYRLLKRHLRTLGLTPEQYRAKWGLPADYPMAAPAYAEQRSQLAKAAGLGRKTRGGLKGRRKGGQMIATAKKASPAARGRGRARPARP